MGIKYSGRLLVSGLLRSLQQAIISALPDWANSTQQTRLQASDAAANDYFGWSVSISSDGNTAIVGAYSDNNSGGTDAGSAYVFTRSGGVWTQQTRLQASDAAASDLFGYSVNISSDGNTAIVGAYSDTNSGGADAGSVLCDLQEVEGFGL
ncbi:MAG: hypothetical protein HC836_48565, partial [Richelia sp. RM2_1_2]|nr:hypothetical protein [Richelia sp. RM2_1_2]